MLHANHPIIPACERVVVLHSHCSANSARKSKAPTLTFFNIATGWEARLLWPFRWQEVVELFVRLPIEKNMKRKLKTKKLFIKNYNHNFSIIIHVLNLRMVLKIIHTHDVKIFFNRWILYSEISLNSLPLILFHL